MADGRRRGAASRSSRSVNIACGAHAGDPATILRTVRARGGRTAWRSGAHPGYPGPRRVRAARPRHDAGRAAGVARRPGRGGPAAAARRGRGAAPREAARRAVQPGGRRPGDWRRRSPRRSATSTRRSSSSAWRGPRRSPRAARPGLAVGRGGLRRPRATRRTARSARGGCDGAVLAEPADAAAQAVSIVRDGAVDGRRRHRRSPCAADTICIHGDSPDARGLRAGGPRGAGRGRDHGRADRSMPDGRASRRPRPPTIEPIGDAGAAGRPRATVDRRDGSPRAQAVAAAIEARARERPAVGRPVPAHASSSSRSTRSRSALEDASAVAAAWMRPTRPGAAPTRSTRRRAPRSRSPSATAAPTGPDLEDVAGAPRPAARATSSSSTRAPTYRSCSSGSRPGFGYLGGLPASLVTPRLRRPARARPGRQRRDRRRPDARSTRLDDARRLAADRPDRRPCCGTRPATRRRCSARRPVRFVPVATSRADDARGRRTGGFLTTVQDAGRPDWTHLGVPSRRRVRPVEPRGREPARRRRRRAPRRSR